MGLANSKTCNDVCAKITGSTQDTEGCSDNFDQYEMFFETFGTMVITSVDMGSRLRKSVLVSDMSVENMETLSEDIEKDYSVAIEAEVSYNGMTKERDCAKGKPCEVS